MEKICPYVCRIDYLHHLRLFYDNIANKQARNKEVQQHSIRPVQRQLILRSLQQMVNSRGIRNKYFIFDVGCGNGSLFPIYFEIANDLNLTLSITSIDISFNMINLAQSRSQQTLENHRGKHSVKFIHAEFVDFVMGEGYEKIIYDKGRGLTDYPSGISNKVHNTFDLVLIQCFEQFFHYTPAMIASSRALKKKGQLVILNPHGVDHVRSHNNKHPEVTPHHLPTILDFRNLTRTQPLIFHEFLQQMELLNFNKTFCTFQLYYASATKSSILPLRDIFRLRAPVMKGHGRGQAIGYPTANLKIFLPDDSKYSLKEVPIGVYLGWAVIEDRMSIRGNKSMKPGRNIWQKAVVNIGHAQIFKGVNEKIRKQPTLVEVHLINDSIRFGDLYNETIRVSLIGYIRGEYFFKSVHLLQEQIKKDVEVVRETLKKQPFLGLRTDTFLVDPCRRVNNTIVNKEHIWVGQSGGDKTTSWEFQPLSSAIADTIMGKWIL